MSPLAISLRFLQTQPDARLVELARAGHERAFEALIRRYRGPLLAYCRRVAPQGTAPEDILQQALLQAWKALSSGSEVRDARAWLYRIVHNVAITALRASGDPREGLAWGSGAPAVDQLVEQRMAAREALAGLAALPDLQRQVMVSTALDGASHEEVAAALGLSSGSVRGLIYRARSTLRAAAAALLPPPVLEWALGDAGGASAGVAGAGSAGLGALVLKGSAILAVGAVAGTAAIVSGHRSHHRHGQAGPFAEAAAGTAKAAPAASLPIGDGAHGPAIASAVRGASSASILAGTISSRDGGARGGSHDGSGGGSGSPFSTSGDGSRGGSSTGGGSRSGSDGGGGHTATTAATGSGGGDGGGTTITTSGGDGSGSSGSSDGGSTSGSPGSGSSSGSSDGGAASSSDGGTTTSTTTTSTTSDH